TRVRQAIAKAAEHSLYADKLAGEKTAFLNTRAFYKECMKQANLKWGWEPKSLGRPMKGPKGN
ncbi:MAG TPA: hypothetical protein VK786_01955, partial [bacterium]|nr:hypothetical protein [bacterium]